MLQARAVLGQTRAGEELGLETFSASWQGRPVILTFLGGGRGAPQELLRRFLRRKLPHAVVLLGVGTGLQPGLEAGGVVVADRVGAFDPSGERPAWIPAGTALLAEARLQTRSSSTTGSRAPAPVLGPVLSRISGLHLSPAEQRLTTRQGVAVLDRTAVGAAAACRDAGVPFLALLGVSQRAAALSAHDDPAALSTALRTMAHLALRIAVAGEGQRRLTTKSPARIASPARARPAVGRSPRKK